MDPQVHSRDIRHVHPPITLTSRMQNKKRSLINTPQGTLLPRTAHTRDTVSPGGAAFPGAHRPLLGKPKFLLVLLTEENLNLSRHRPEEVKQSLIQPIYIPVGAKAGLQL